MKHLQIDFAKDQCCFVPSAVSGAGGSSIERYWDQYETDQGSRLSRPRSIADADVNVSTGGDSCRIVVTWPTAPLVSRIVTANVAMSYEPCD